MHEMSLIAALIRKVTAIAAEQHGARVTGVKVRLGALSHMSASHFSEHFNVAARGTIAEGAVLTATVSTDVDDPNAQDILLESIEVED